MIAPKYLPSYTYADYVQWEGDWELFEGIPYTMLPSPKIDHQRIARNFIVQIGTQLLSCKDCEVAHGIDWRVSENTVFRPDILVTCSPVTTDFLEFPPNLIIEISSKSTLFKDTSIKYETYEKQGVPYYIIANGMTKTAYVYYLENGQYSLKVELRTGCHTFQLKDCPLVIDFGKVWP